MIEERANTHSRYFGFGILVGLALGLSLCSGAPYSEFKTDMAFGAILASFFITGLSFLHPDERATVKSAFPSGLLLGLGVGGVMAMRFDETDHNANSFFDSGPKATGRLEAEELSPFVNK